MLVKNEEWVRPHSRLPRGTHRKGGRPVEAWDSPWSEAPHPTAANGGCCLRTAPKEDHVCRSLSLSGCGHFYASVFTQPAHLLVFFFLFQEEMGISCELLESDFLKCSVGFPFMRSKSKVRGRVGDFPGSPQPFPPASDSNSGLALRFPPAPDGPWSRGLSLSSKRRAPSVRDALWPYRFGKQHLVGRLRVLFSGTFHEPWSP